MSILITVLLLFLTAITLLILRARWPQFRFAWLTAVGGAFLAWMSTFLWQVRLPLSLDLPPWQPAALFADTPSFVADGLSWPYALSLITIALAVLLTTVVRQDFPNLLNWAGTLGLTAFGVLAVTANNPLTLVLLWAAIDLVELISMLRSVNDPVSSERVVIAFATQAAGGSLLLWANMVSVAAGSKMDFLSMPPQAGPYLLVAAGLRLGVLPLHLPYATESGLRRGFGTILRLVSAASSLILLARIPPSSIVSPFTPLLLILTTIAALYGGWMWLRAPDELTGRPFWMIGLGALAVAAALRADPPGAAAWGCALILIGGALFLSSVQHIWLDRALLVGAWGLSSLPFSLTASGWLGSTPAAWLFWPLLLAAQALLIAGFIRQALRRSGRDALESQPAWAQRVYPFGVGAPLFALLILGVSGWDGALQLGVWPASLTASLLTFGLIWLTPRLGALNPVRAHWIRTGVSPWLDYLYRGLWSLYQTLGRLGQSISSTLEGEGGVMWTLLFLVLFISLMTQRTP